MAEPPPWLDEVQWPPARMPADVVRPAPLLVDSRQQPIATREAWNAHRLELERRWRAYLGHIPAPATTPIATTLEEDRRDGVLRRLVRYEAEPGLPVEAYWLSPLGVWEDPENRKWPGVVVFHSTSDDSIRQPAGLGGSADKFIGLKLARRGYVVLCPRCFLWQYSKDGKIQDAVDWLHRRHPGITGMAKMLFDARRAVDLLASLTGVDPNRLGAIGHSLGAKEALFLAAFDTRIRAAVSSEGGLGIAQSNWDAPWYLGAAAKRPDFPLEHAQLLAMAAPRAFLLLAGDSADGDASWPSIEAALPVWSLLGAPSAIGMYNHHEGHVYPATAGERAGQWLDWFLRVP